MTAIIIIISVYYYYYCYAPCAALRAAVQPVPQDGDGDASMMRNMRCKVCLSEESNTVFQPCHHISCCSSCAHRLDNARCPVCRAPINDVLPVYIA